MRRNPAAAFPPRGAPGGRGPRSSLTQGEEDGAGGRARLSLPHTPPPREAPRPPLPLVRAAASPHPPRPPGLGAPCPRGTRAGGAAEGSASPECPTPPSGTRHPWGRGSRSGPAAATAQARCPPRGLSPAPAPPSSAGRRLCACVVGPPGRVGWRPILHGSVVRVPPPADGASLGIPEGPVTARRRVFVYFLF